MSAVMCFVVVALSGAGLAGIAFSHEITGVDALLLALICLAIGGLFTLFLVFALKGAMKGGSESSGPPPGGGSA